MTYASFIPHHDPFPYSLFSEVANRCADGEIIVEVGAFLGHGTCYMAEQLARLDKRPRFYAIDSFDQVLEPVWGEMRTEPMPWGEPIEAYWKRGGNLYDAFLFHLSQCPAADRVYDYAQFPAASCFGEWEDGTVSAAILHYSRDDVAIDKQVAGWWAKLKPGGLLGVFNPNWNGSHTRTMVKA